MTFSTLLVANRGEIARRVIRGARAMGLRTVAIYVAADADAPYVRDADVAVLLATGYLDVDAVLAAAALASADAVHPGYGFLSENAAFAQRVLDEGLTWVGPPPSVIAAMGDKLAAKRLAQASGVPILDSSEDERDVARVGYPVLVKAAAGGGGKGMRVVERPEDLPDAVAAARREALSGFGDDRVFFERYVARSRHVEIQIIGDDHGHLLHLGERECSIQRRHQKLVEESPSPVLDATTRAAMGDAALRLARALNYVSVGTVEFLVDDATHEFFFLEVNTRLQVEHPITEEVTGVDLVRAQLLVAQGDALDFSQEEIRSHGHAVEVRLCAEDAPAGFLPATGTLVAFEPAAEPSVRWESGVEVGSIVGPSFDPLLAKIVAHRPTRDEAVRVLALALERLHLGGVTTNRDFLVATLRDEHFASGETTTDFIERFSPARTLTPSVDERTFALVAGTLWLQAARRRSAAVLGQVPSGWRNARLPAQEQLLRDADGDVTVHYRARRDGSFDLGAHGDATVYAANERVIDLDVNGRRARARVTHANGHLYVQCARGTLEFFIVPRFAPPAKDVTPGGLHAPMPGAVLDVRVAAGQRVTRGDTLVVLEAMKMEHVITAPSDGVILDVLVKIGQQVSGGDELLALEVEEADEA